MNLATSLDSLYLDEPASYIRSCSDVLRFALMTRLDPYAPRSKRKNVHTEMHATLGLTAWLDYARDTYPDRDIWVSQAEFFGYQRKAKYVSRIAVLFSDLDTYGPNATAITRGTPEDETAQLLAWCQKAGVPKPSTVIFSGQGLQAKWLLKKPLHQKDLKRWTKIQKEFQQRLAPLGADPQAIDVCRVLRLVGSINQKTGQLVRETFTSNIIYDFEQLAREFDTYAELPEVDLEIDEAGNVRKPNNNIRQVEKSNLPSISEKKNRSPYTGPKNISGLSKFNASKFSSDRIDDLVTLAKLRNAKGRIEDGKRDIFIFLAAVFLVQAHVDQNLIDARLIELARSFVPHWPKTKIDQSAYAAITRLREAIKGETVTFNGQEIDPRYRFKNETLISNEWLDITQEEQSKLKTIIGTEEKKKRDQKRALTKREEAGQQTLKQYRKSKEEKKIWALDLKAHGATWSDIALMVGYKNAESARKTCAPVKDSQKENRVDSVKKQPLPLSPFICTDAKTPLLKKEQNSAEFYMRGADAKRSGASAPLPPAAAQQFLDENTDAPLLKRA